MAIDDSVDVLKYFTTIGTSTDWGSSLGYDALKVRTTDSVSEMPFKFNCLVDRVKEQEMDSEETFDLYEIVIYEETEESCEVIFEEKIFAYSAEEAKTKSLMAFGSSLAYDADLEFNCKVRKFQ